MGLQPVLLEGENVGTLDTSGLGLALDVDDLVLGQLEAGHQREANHDAQPVLALLDAASDSTDVQVTQVQGEDACDVAMHNNGSNESESCSYNLSQFKHEVSLRHNHLESFYYDTISV